MSWEPLNLAAPEFAAKTPPPEFCGLVYRKRRHVISGPPESAKTVLAWIIGLEALRSGVPVAQIDFEMGPAPTRELLEDLGATPEEIGSVLYFDGPDRVPDADTLALLVNEGIGLAIVDAAVGAFDASGLDDNKRADVQRFARAWIDPLWQRGIAPVLLDHVTKNAETRGKYAIGSERKVGLADVHLGIEDVRALTRGGSGLYRVRVHKDRPAWLRRPYAAELELRSDPTTHGIEWTFRQPGDAAAADEWLPTVLMQRASEYVIAHPGASRNEIEKNVRGKSNAHKRQALDASSASATSSNPTVHGVPAPTRAPPPTPRPTSPRPRPAKSPPTSPTSPAPYRGRGARRGRARRRRGRTARRGQRVAATTDAR